VAQKVFHLTAQHECRYNFALNSVARDWPELALPGMHSDIGGGYLPQLREDLFLTRPLVETLPQNQPSAQSHVYQQAIAQLHVLGRSPAILPIIRTSKITPKYGKTIGYPTTTTVNDKTHIRRPDSAPPDCQI
jgi:hypothetical protein